MRPDRRVPTTGENVLERLTAYHWIGTWRSREGSGIFLYDARYAGETAALRSDVDQAAGTARIAADAFTQYLTLDVHDRTGYTMGRGGIDRVDSSLLFAPYGVTDEPLLRRRGTYSGIGKAMRDTTVDGSVAIAMQPARHDGKTDLTRGMRRALSDFAEACRSVEPLLIDPYVTPRPRA